jgi:hypothetical protein
MLLATVVATFLNQSWSSHVEKKGKKEREMKRATSTIV